MQPLRRKQLCVQDSTLSTEPDAAEQYVERTPSFEKAHASIPSELDQLCTCTYSVCLCEHNKDYRSGLQNNVWAALLVTRAFSILKEQRVHLKSQKINFKIFL